MRPGKPTESRLSTGGLQWADIPRAGEECRAESISTGGRLPTKVGDSILRTTYCQPCLVAYELLYTTTLYIGSHLNYEIKASTLYM